MMNGTRSFFTDKYLGETRAYFMLELLRGYKAFIGFSATITICGLTMTKQVFKDHMYVNIKSLTQEKIKNRLIGFCKASTPFERYEKIMQHS